MTSIKIKFRPSITAGKEGSIYYQIIHNRQVRQILSRHKMFPDEWNAQNSTIFIGIRQDVERLNRIIKMLDERNGVYTADDVVEEYDNYRRSYSLFGYIEAIITTLKQRKRIRTAETYQATLNSLRKFFVESGYLMAGEVMLDCISSEIVEDYEAYLQAKGLVPNTTSFYMRILRAIYNRAVDDGILDRKNPFRHVYTGVEKTVKRALSVDSIRMIKSLELPARSSLDYARDMFMMSFYLRGMSFVDMAFLRKADLVRGYISYRRRKTGQSLTIKWTQEMQDIVNKYPVNTTCYLLPIITNSAVNELNAYRRCGYKINFNLKIVAELASLEIPLTLYYARHSWASIAKSKGVPLSVISEGMGHDSELTTRIYLASLDASIVDNANSLIISSL